MDFWLYPGVLMNVSVPMKITMIPVAPGEVPPPGTTIIPPQTPTVTPMSQTIRAAVAANLETAKQGLDAATAITNQQTAEAQAAFDVALAKTNEEAAKLRAAEVSQAAGQPPPWSVTFTEQR